MNHVSGFGWLHSDPSFRIDQRRHYDYLIMNVLGGILHVEQAGCHHQLGAGSLILMDLAHEHSYYAETSDPCDFQWLHFNGPACEGLMDLITRQRSLPIILRPHDTIRRLLEQSLLIGRSMYPGADLHLSAIIYDLLIEIAYHMQQAERSLPAESYAAMLRRLDQFLDARLDQTITLDMLADQCAMSRFHFARQFKAWTGQSPMHYVMQRKIARARFLLLYTQDTVAAIANTLGFSDLSHFSRLFSRYEGQSPSRFRNGQTP